MNIVKAIGLLTIGAIVGYGVSFIGKAENKERVFNDDVIISKTYLPAKTIEAQVTSVNVEHNVVAHNNSPTKNIQPETAKLENKVLNKKHLDLVKENKILKDKYDKSLDTVRSLQSELNKLYVSEVTDYEMEALVPEPFKPFLKSYQGKGRDKIFNFHQQEDDYNWGFEMQTNISDFFQIHYESTNIEIISVTCKQPHCEILAIEKQEGAWKQMMKDIYQQPWLKFSSATHSTRSNIDNQLIVYAFFSK